MIVIPALRYLWARGAYWSCVRILVRVGWIHLYCRIAPRYARNRALLVSQRIMDRHGR